MFCKIAQWDGEHILLAEFESGYLEILLQPALQFQGGLLIVIQSNGQTRHMSHAISSICQRASAVLQFERRCSRAAWRMRLSSSCGPCGQAIDYYVTNGKKVSVGKHIKANNHS